MSRLQLLDAHQHEIETVLRGWRVSCDGNDDPAAHLEWNTKLAELLANQRRAIEFMHGKTPEPILQFGEAVINLKGGL